MTWDELKEKAKEMGCEIKYEGQDSELIIVPTNDTGELCFYKDGDIKAFDYPDSVDLCRKMTPEQMLMIMRGLE